MEVRSVVDGLRDLMVLKRFRELEDAVRREFPKAFLYLVGHGGTIWRVVVSGGVGVEERHTLLTFVRSLVGQVNREYGGFIFHASY